jgi:hypothetical protein
MATASLVMNSETMASAGISTSVRLEPTTARAIASTLQAALLVLAPMARFRSALKTNGHVTTLTLAK